VADRDPTAVAQLVLAHAKTAATFGTSGIEQSSSSAAFSPFVSAGVMF
jgi:hypothetical protein